MATLILGTVGQIFGGPVGGIIGTALGGLVDRSVFASSGQAREQGRISNPAVQSATYGEPIPIIVGRMRAAGNLIWTSGIREQSITSGGGKRSGPATTNFTYTASFAVGLVARQIADVGRIWADGKLIRGADGVFVSPVTMRLHNGDDDQAVDPLISAAEGAGGTPAYRGLAYVVFEDLPLGDFGNRIPNLTFEVIADVASIDAGGAIAALANLAGADGLTITGRFPPMSGHIVSRTGSLADAIAPLLAISDAVVSTGEGLAIIGSADVTAHLPAMVGDAVRPGDDRQPARIKRSGSDAEAGCLELAYYDTTRDYQPGVQRVRRSARATVDQRAISAAMSPDEAKGLALQLLVAGQAGRIAQSLRLSWRHLGLRPGTRLTFAGSPHAWRVREQRFENFIVNLDLQRVTAVPPAPVGLMEPALQRAELPGDGIAFRSIVEAIGTTSVDVLDLPMLPGESGGLPRLWVAAASAAAGWRRAGIAASLDNGASFAGIGAIEGGSVMGVTNSVLAPGAALAWDNHADVEVELLSDRDWLEGRSATAVLAGGNLALVGNELVQFVHAEALAPRRFRLHGLLRGRRGTEAAIDTHRVGERFVLIDPTRMLAFDAPIEALGRMAQFVPTGADDAETEPTRRMIAGTALRPLSPVHLRARLTADSLVLTWVRRSRSGFGWIDFVDTPIGEAMESYLVSIASDDRTIWQTVTDRPSCSVELAALHGSDRAHVVVVSIAQISGVIGPGGPATIAITLPNEGDIA